MIPAYDDGDVDVDSASLSFLCHSIDSKTNSEKRQEVRVERKRGLQSVFHIAILKVKHNNSTKVKCLTLNSDILN